MNRNVYGAMNPNYKSLILTVSLFFALSTTISAAPGDLDLSFGRGGIVLTSFAPDEYWYDSARTVRVQPDGKIVVCGWISDTDNNGDRGFFLARYHPTGAVDASFGTNGKITGPINIGEMVGNDIALQPDGKIIAVGFGFFPYGFAVHRYNANGTLDASFGAGGVVLTPVGEYAVASSVAIQADGKIVVAGFSESAGESYNDLTVVRLLPDGSLDTSFNGTGKVITSFGNSSAAQRVFVQPDGKIVAVGQVDFAIYSSAFALARYNTDGSLDSGFGSGGKITHAVSNGRIYFSFDAALQPDGKIVTSGRFSAPPNNNWDIIIRCNPNGSRDMSFATNGVFTPEPNLYIANGIALQPDGKLVAFGYENGGGNYRFAILRLNPNGAPDTGFGTNGRVFTQIGSSGSSAADGALQPDGKILALGVTSLGFTDNDIAIVRYRGDSAPTPPCGNPIDCPEFFIRQQYLDFLGREPDANGFANWMATLTGCPNGGFGEFDNPLCDRVHVSAGFVHSHEFQGRGYWILRFGYVGLNRSIGTVRSSATYAEFNSALAQVGGSNSPAQEEAAKVTYANAFVQRQDFLTLFPATMTASQYVNALESNAQVTLSNKQALIDALNAGTMSRAAVLRNVVESQVVFDKYLIPAFVTMEYFGYLRRDPDLIGYQNWVNTLTAEPNNYRHMIFGFIYSTEYRRRFGAP